MPARSAASAARKTARGATRSTSLPPISLQGRPFALVGLVASAIVVLAVTNLLTTPDFWQHLVVGKAIWQLGRIPQEHLWTWPSFGQREVLPSWGFRWLLWPFYAIGGVFGLQVWRWLTTLAAYAAGFVTARRLGARGLTPLVVISLAVLSYRTRAQVRPETLVAMLLALEVMQLERRRIQGGGALGLLAIAWAWANVHISYFVGLALIAFHCLTPNLPVSAEERPGFWTRADRMPTPLVLVLAAAISFVNPYGWRALRQPFEYFLVWRHEPIYQTIPELSPLLVTWRSYLASGLPVLVIAWPALVLVRATMHKFDLIEALTCALMTGLALFNQRFVGFLMVANVPYLSRALSELAGGMRWPATLRPPAARATMAALLMIAASLPSWADTRFRLGIGFVPMLYPERACTFLAQHQLSGRMFNPYYFGGYIAWRFWPDQSRLPFIDIHQTGSRHDRDLYSYAFADSNAWGELMREHDFELAILDGHQEWVHGDRLLDFLDADHRWALVFRDDAAALYVRRDGRFAAIADSLAYRAMPGGTAALVASRHAIAADSMLRRALRRELDRRVAESPENAQAHSLLADLDFLERNRAGARAHLLAALAVDPTLSGAHRRLGYLLMAEERWRDAIREFEAERRLGGTPEDEFMRIGLAWEKLGDRSRAADAYRRELDIHAANDNARDALRRLESKGGQR
jgi:hypothetical protein